jgi:hypothetical protein
MHCHVLGVVLSPIIAALLVADVRRRRGPERAPVILAAMSWLAIGLVSYVPLLIYELTTGGSETRAALAFLTGGPPADVALPARFPVVGLRVLAWPLTGLVTTAPIAALLSAALVVGLAIWRAVRATDEERTAVRWLGLGLVWTVVALAVGASGLATVVAGLPNDHYHAFADPIVVVLVGVGLAALARQPFGGLEIGRMRAGALAAVPILVALIAWNVTHQPPAVAPDGGWPAAADAAARILRSAPTGPTEIVSLPAVKGPDAVRFPLVRAGAPLPALVAPTSEPAPGTQARIVLCDDLFRDAIGAACGGPAEGAVPASTKLKLADQFEAAPGRWISVYLPD